jgi:hypothetical protein
MSAIIAQSKVQNDLRSDSGDGSDLTSDLVKDLVGLSRVGVDGSDQTVFYQVSTFP